MLRNGCTIPVEVIYPGVHCSILSLLYPMTPHYSPSSVRTAYHYVLRLDPAYEGKQPWSIPYWVKGNVLVDLIHTKQCFYRGKERSFHAAIICDETQCIGEYLQSKAKQRTERAYLKSGKFWKKILSNLQLFCLFLQVSQLNEFPQTCLI